MFRGLLVCSRGKFSAVVDGRRIYDPNKLFIKKGIKLEAIGLSR